MGDVGVGVWLVVGGVVVVVAGSGPTVVVGAVLLVPREVVGEA